MLECKERLAQQIRLRITGDREVVHLLGRHPRHIQARADGVSRKPRTVLDPPEPLLLDRREQLPLAEQRRRHISVIRVDP